MPSEQKLASRPAERGAGRRHQARAGLSVALVAAIGLVAWRGNGQEVPPERRALLFAQAPSAVTVSADGREVLVEFPKALPDGEADRVAHALGPLLESYSEGFGAVRFRFGGPVAATAPPGSRTVELVAQSPVASAPEDERRLAILQARQAALDGDVRGARARLRQILAERPGDLDATIALADTEIGADRWQHALGLYDGVLRLFPEATDIGRDRSALAYRNGPAIRFTFGATFGPNGERSQTGTVAGDLPLGEAWRVGGSVQAVHDTIRGLRRSGSAVAADFSDTKPLGGLWLSHNWNAPGDVTRVDLFSAPETTGFSVKQDVSSRWGQTTIGALYHQPYWGTVMSFAANARRDQIGVAQTVPLPDRWEVQLGAGLIRYGLPGYDSVASGPTALAGVSYGLPERWLPLDGLGVRAGYRMEAEYLSGVQTGPTSAGPMALLDVRQREIHSLYAETTLPIGIAQSTTVLGYAVDRYGGGGPQASIRLATGGDGDRLAFAVEAGLEPSLDIKPRTLFHVGGSFVWRFGDGATR